MGGFAMEEISRQPASRILKTMWVYLQRRYKVLVLVVILCLAGYLRFYGVTQRGLVDHDEAAYLLEVKSLIAGLQVMAGHQPIGQINISIAHPGHTFLI